MDFDLSSEQRMLVETVRRFVAEHLQPLEQEIEDKGFLEPDEARAVFENSRALGLYAMNIPAEYGGGGLSTLDWMLAEEQFGRTSDILVRRAFGNVYEVLLEADAEQRARWLLPSARGERTGSLAFTEPGAGSDAAGIRTRAVASGAGWRLTGHKHFVSDGLFSDYFIVSAVTDPAAGPKGISLFLVDKDLPGVVPGRDQPMMGLRGTPHIELFLDDVELGPMHLLGTQGDGLKLALATLGRVRLAQIGARAIGKAALLLDLASEQARARKQFGKPIGEFQMVQQMLADSAVEVHAARLALWQAAWETDQGRDLRGRISMVKVQAAETLGRVADRTVQIFGGMGYCKDLAVERYYRDARIYRIYDGTSEIHRTVIARALLGGESALYDGH